MRLNLQKGIAMVAMVLRNMRGPVVTRTTRGFALKSSFVRSYF